MDWLLLKIVCKRDATSFFHTCWVECAAFRTEQNRIYYFVAKYHV